MKIDRFDTDIPITDFEGKISPDRFCEPESKGSGSHRRSSVLVLSVLGACLICLMGYLILGSFRISNISVVGNASYSDAEILASSGLNNSPRYIKFNSNDAEKALLEACPMIESATIDKSFPFGATVTVIESEVVFYTAFEDKWYSLTDKLKVIEEARYADRFEERGLLLLQLPLADGFEVGKTPTFDNCEYNTDYLWTFAEGYCACREECGFDVAYVSLTEKFDIALSLNDGSRVILGSAESTERKLKKAAAVMLSMRRETDSPLQIDVSDPEKAICRVIDR